MFQALECNYFTTLVKFIPKYFFGQDFKWDCFVSSSFCHFIVSVKMQNNSVSWDSCIKIFFLVSFYLTAFIYSDNSCVGTLGFSLWSIMSLADSDNLTSFLPNCIYFIPFPCLIAVTRISNAILNRSGEMGILVLFLNLAERFSAFHL